MNNIPKIELHLHLDGSVSLELASKLSNLSVEEVKEKMVAKDKETSLTEYLTKFDLPISLMQSKENLKLVAQNLIKTLEEENVIYAEIRFAPMFHTNNLTYEEVIDSVLFGLNSSKVKTNLILCMMRGAKKEDNLKTIEVAKKYLNKGVCGIDLAGDENIYPLDNYLDLFDKIKKLNIPFTIHVGENGSNEEIIKAINIGTKRIGHGIKALENTLNLIKKNNILLEICPTSNVQTNAVDKYFNHPIYKFYQKGIKVCINTDNKTVSNINLNQEYEKLSKYFDITKEDFKTLNLYAIESSFLSDEEKNNLKTLL